MAYNSVIFIKLLFLKKFLLTYIIEKKIPYLEVGFWTIRNNLR